MLAELSLDLTQAMVASALGNTAAVALVLCLRVPLRMRWGASAAYALWACVPLCTVAALLPVPWAVLGGAPAWLVELQLGAVGAISTDEGLVPTGHFGSVTLLAILWGLGCMAGLLRMIRQHQLALGSLGPLRPLRGRTQVQQARGASIGPLSLGLLRPVVVVPQDFQRRYSRQERSLMWAHERVHIQRRDAWANVVVGTWQCVHWFNPLVHIAAARFRLDQELACDEAVMRRHPRSARTYAQALLKAGLAPNSPRPARSALFSTPPLKERIMNLSQPARRFRASHRAAIAAFALATSMCTWAWSSPAPAATSSESAQKYDLRMVLSENGKAVKPRMIVAENTPASLRMGEGESALSIALTVQSAAAGQVKLAGHIHRGNKLLASPSLLTQLGQAGSVKIDGKDGPLELQVTTTAVPVGQKLP